MKALPILLAWSGGKDSTMALERLLDDSRWRVAGLLTTVTSGYERIAIHGVRRSILHAQVATLGLPLIEAEIPPAASNEVYEAAFVQALEKARERDPDIADIAFGDLFLADVRAYREAMLARSGWRGVYPLWGEDTKHLARYFVDRGYRAILAVSIRSSSMPTSADASTTSRCSMICRRPATPAARTANFIPVCMPARCGSNR